MAAESVERTFCFVDLAGFTALTEAHGDIEAVALLDRFLALTRASMGPGDELVKTIGDAVMLASPSPQSALRALVALVAGCANATGFPLPRTGVHHGSGIVRGHDYLGGAVNLAARVAAHARGGQVLATAEVADAARGLALDVRALGGHRLRNVAQPVELFEVRLGVCEGSDTVDPVCRMRLEREDAAGTLRHQNEEYWFCSLSCVVAFAADPDTYATVPRLRRLTVPTMSRVEQALCRSAPWRAFTRAAVLPWAMQGVHPKGPMLEIGSGSGAMAAAIVDAHPGVDLTVTDYDPSMVDAARKRLRPHRSAEVRQADATDLDFDDGSFDVVASFIMLHHVGAWEQAIAEAVRVLRPHGTLVGYDLLATRPLEALHRAERAEHRLMSLPGLRTTLAALPLDDVAVRPGLGGLVVRFRARRSSD